MRVLTVPHSQSFDSQDGFHGADAGIPIEDDGAFGMSCVSLGVLEKALCLGNEVSRSSRIRLDLLDLGASHWACSGWRLRSDPMSGFTGPRMIPRTRLFPLSANEANSAGV